MRSILEIISKTVDSYLECAEHIDKRRHRRRTHEHNRLHKHRASNCIEREHDKHDRNKHVRSHHDSCDGEPKYVRAKHNHSHHEWCDGERVVVHHARDRIVNKLHDVAQNLQSKIATDTNHRLEDYFTQTTDGELVPKMFRIRNGEHVINVPKFTLVNHSNIDMKEIKCKFRTDAFNLGIDCENNFAVDTEVVFERNGNIDGYTRINELLIREYM
jgi:hypothetical protein